MKKYSIEWWSELRPERIGKETEKIIQDIFVKWNSKVTFAYHRMPDTRSARGMIAAQPGDYMYRCGNNAGFIEVKATQHEYRLSKDKVSQLAQLQKWAMAGDKGLVIINHYTLGKWRCVRPASLTIGQPSWDLREVPVYDDAKAALLSSGYFGGLHEYE